MLKLLVVHNQQELTMEERNLSTLFDSIVKVHLGRNVGFGGLVTNNERSNLVLRFL
jgi:hypothetical protein